MSQSTPNTPAELDVIIHGDALHELQRLPDCSVDLVLTDPPYFLHKLDNNWSPSSVHDERHMYAVNSLPAGMRFDRQQGVQFHSWYLQICAQLIRILKPGGFFFSFSSPRLYHRMACAMDDAGFELRDCFVWLYTQNQAKAMSLDHFVRKLDIEEAERDRLLQRLHGWKTPQVRSCFEPIAMAQKPVQHTYLSNMSMYDVGLVNTQVRLGTDAMFPCNVVSTEPISEQIDRVFLTGKPSKNEKQSYNTHKTVKPTSICEYLISLTTANGAVVLDPFLGSGTTALSCLNLGRHYIGIELNVDYVDIARRRILDRTTADQ